MLQVLRRLFWSSITTRLSCTILVSVCFQVNSILRHVGELLDLESDEQLEDLYQKTAWFFDRKYGKTGASYEAFKHAVTYVVVSKFISLRSISCS